MADMPFSHTVILQAPVERRPQPVAPRWAQKLDLSPNMANGLIVLVGAIVFALAGGLLGNYLMLPFEIG